ncbi:ankyrin repeat domain-containing protein, partial [Planctomycetota bacterium]
MKNQHKFSSILKVMLLSVTILAFFPVNSSATETQSSDPNRYLDAVREFADNVLKYGRDTYGPKHTPLFVDGVNVNTHEPVKWISPVGGDVLTATETEEWILSNFASQQTLLRTLDGLSTVTGDPQYRDAAMKATKYAFENLRAPNGLFYWGHYVAYNAQEDRIMFPSSRSHILKLHYPYYELMWKVDPEETKKFIEAYWSAHVRDWSNLDFDRIASYSGSLEEPWKHEYDEDGPIFFKGSGGGFFSTASSLVQAGTTLYILSDQEEPLIWSKRLIKRFIDTRHPITGIFAGLYNDTNPTPPLGDDLKDHFVEPRTTVFPWRPYEETRYVYWPEDKVAQAQWLSLILTNSALGNKGKEFGQWALEELTACGKKSYRKKDNSFIPILTDGTNIEGYVLKKQNNYGPEGAIANPLFADFSFFWAYATAYHISGEEFMWEMSRDIVLGNSLGDIGRSPKDTPEIQTNTTCSDVYGLLGFLELYEKTDNPSFLQIAQRIGDNIVANQFHKGFFVPSEKHIYTRFDCFEPLALLHLVAAIKSETVPIPQVWPSCPLFVPPYRYKEMGVDRQVIYSLTESSELPLSLQEAASIGDINLVLSLLEQGIGVDSWGYDAIQKTALHRAALSGHKEIIKLLIARGAQIDIRDDWPGSTALSYAAGKGHKEIVEFLIDAGADVNVKDKEGQTALHQAAIQGYKDIVELLLDRNADVNAKNNNGQTPFDIAVSRNRQEIVELLKSKIEISSIHLAAQLGDLEKVKEFLEQGVDVNTKDENGQIALHQAVRSDNKEIVELLIDQGADVNIKDENVQTALHIAANNDFNDITEFLIDQGADVNAKDENNYTPLYYAIFNINKDMVSLLVSKGANVNVTPEKDYPPLHYAVWMGDLDIVKTLVDKGAKSDVKVLVDEMTALHYAVLQGSRDMVELFISKGVDTSSLHMAALIGDLDHVKEFIEQGTEVDANDEAGWPALCWAVCAGQTKVAEFLIDNNADISFNYSP